jgi:hypothetical protein
MAKVTVTVLPALNTLVIKQVEGKDFFISTNDSIIISVQNLAFILSFLVNNGFVSHKVLEGILEDYHTDKGAKSVIKTSGDSNFG